MENCYPQILGLHYNIYLHNTLEKTAMSRDKRRVSEIDSYQPRHEAAFWWRQKGPVTSQLTDPIKWPNYLLELIVMYVHTNTHNHWLKDVVDRQMYNCVWYLYIYLFAFSLNGWHALFCITNSRHDVIITPHAVKRHFLIRMATVMFLCFDFKIHLYLCIYLSQHFTTRCLDYTKSIFSPNVCSDTYIKSFIPLYQIFHNMHVNTISSTIWRMLMMR